MGRPWVKLEGSSSFSSGNPRLSASKPLDSCSAKKHRAKYKLEWKGKKTSGSPPLISFAAPKECSAFRITKAVKFQTLEFLQLRQPPQNFISRAPCNCYGEASRLPGNGSCYQLQLRTDGHVALDYSLTETTWRPRRPVAAGFELLLELLRPGDGVSCFVWLASKLRWAPCRSLFTRRWWGLWFWRSG